MANREKKLNQKRLRKQLSVRSDFFGTKERPRLTVFRSSKNIYCQVVDDERGATLASASTRDKTLRDAVKGLKKAEAAERVGSAVAERAKAAGVARVFFDRGHYKYHGRVKALADAARKGGLEF
jgi:large subunit ribosomal protein L18